MKGKVAACKLLYETKRKFLFRRHSLAFAARRSLARQMSSIRSPSCRLLNVSDSRTTRILLHAPRLRAKNTGAVLAFQGVPPKSPDRLALASREVQLDCPPTTTIARQEADTVHHRVFLCQVQMVCRCISHSAITHPPRPLAPLHRNPKAPNQTPDLQVPTDLLHNLLLQPSFVPQAKAENDIRILETI